jgi:uncharacterized DUF497 family protein
VFTWDEKKRKLNLAKHGVDFRDAPAIFDGPLVVVSVTYTERRDEVRLISIRKALKHETHFFLSQVG